ncbi:putative baseplate assembly protein [Amycolatopsis anabasis]|uniref:putative baseplate assembly protein n=1 Tax=Amycolatopsis anabasis TaxID=1840409 RepID=UPI00131CE63C|nr:putative baseplate assembly protein [Amycolatopsis anabasis]
MSACECGCCDGVATATPVSTENRPGLPAISYRMGTHGGFRESMLARLSTRPALAGLTTREPDDPAIALLDCWAVLGDVLTFYQERIANEGYLRTATEPESLAELGKLVGYTPRPALGSTTYLAYTLDPGARTVIPAGSGAKSVPKQNELPQTFETTEELVAREEWNTLGIAMTEPPELDATTVPAELGRFAVKGTVANLRQGDRLLFLLGVGKPLPRVVEASKPDFQADRTEVTLVRAAGRSDDFTLAIGKLKEAVGAALGQPPKSQWTADTVAALTGLKPALEPVPADPGTLFPKLRALVPVLRERGAIARAHGNCADTAWFDVLIGEVLRAALAALRLAAETIRESDPEVRYLRDLATELICPKPGCGGSKAEAANGGCCEHDSKKDCGRAVALVGLTPVLPWLRREPSRPPKRSTELVSTVDELFRPDADTHPKLLIAADPRLAPNLHRAWANQRITPPEPVSDLQVFRVKAKVADTKKPGGNGGDVHIVEAAKTEIWLDTVYDGILPGSWVLVESAGKAPQILKATAVEQRQLAVTVDKTTVEVPVTVLTFDGTVTAAKGEPVFAQGESLTPVGDPITADIEGDEIELARVYDGLRPGRWLVVSGERTDVPHTSGIQASELTMIAGIRQRVNRDKPGDAVRTFLLLATELSYTYKRDTVKLYGNVAEANQGETRNEILGSGDAGQANQAFRLRQANADNPLTFLPSDNPLGAESTLTTRITGVRWQETDDLIFSGPTDHSYAVTIGNDKSVTAGFGDGVHGARVPTGAENVTATYRTGAGRSGNVAANQITQLAARPLGVNAVTNPLPATGAADGDGPGDARITTPLRMLALDRLVSVRDYQDFTRARAGIGKAVAAKLHDGEREIVQVTIAGTGDVPIDPASGLFTTLESALVRFGDLGVPVRVGVREHVLLVLKAGVKVLPDHSWDLVQPVVRAALLAEFGFARRELGEPAYLSQAIAAVQAVPGVDYVDVDVFDGIQGDVDPITLAKIVDALTGAKSCVPALPARYDVREHEVVEDNRFGVETLTAVAVRYGLTVDELAKLNPQVTAPQLTPGQLLTVSRGIRPAQLAVLPADVPEALTLTRIR